MVEIKSKINVLRALSKVVAKKATFLLLLVAGAFLAVFFIAICLLVYLFGPWWWLLLIIYIPLFIVSAIVYITARIIAHGLYPVSLTREQRQHLSDFTDKILRLLETRGMGWWVFAGLCVRDLLLYRELRTVKSLLSDTITLQRDFKRLEQELTDSATP